MVVPRLEEIFYAHSTTDSTLTFYWFSYIYLLPLILASHSVLNKPEIIFLQVSRYFYLVFNMKKTVDLFTNILKTIDFTIIFPGEYKDRTTSTLIYKYPSYIEFFFGPMESEITKFDCIYKSKQVDREVVLSSVCIFLQWSQGYLTWRKRERTCLTGTPGLSILMHRQQLLL